MGENYTETFSDQQASVVLNASIQHHNLSRDSEMFSSLKGNITY